MPPEQLENQPNEAGADTAAAADTSNAGAATVETGTQDQLVETGAGQIAKSALDAAFAQASANIEKVVTPPAPAPAEATIPPNGEAVATATTDAGDTHQDVAKAAASSAVQSDETEVGQIQAVLTELQNMRNAAETAGLVRKASLLGSACSSIVYLLAAINEPDRDYDFYMSALVSDLVKNQQTIEAAFTKVSTAKPDPDEGLVQIEKAVTDGLAGITELISGLADRVDAIERRPAAGGPVLRPVEKTFSSGLAGGPANQDERRSAIETLKKMQSETTDPFQKARLGEAIAHAQIKNNLNFQN